MITIEAEDLYEILNTSRDASPQELEVAFRNHPVPRAYSLLSDPELRKDYDDSLDFWETRALFYGGGNPAPGSEVQDFYEVLGVKRYAPIDDIETAYQGHSVVKAYALLSDPKFRKEYDRYLEWVEIRVGYFGAAFRASGTPMEEAVAIEKGIASSEVVSFWSRLRNFLFRL